jgi:hypothetical protein
VLQVLLDLQVKLVIQALQALLEKPVILDLLVHKDLKAQQVLLEHKVK